MPVIELQDVSKLYGFGDATTVALDEVSLRIDKGEFVAVMGPSGSGKSSLMNILGLLDRPTHGAYELDGRSVARLRANQRAKMRRNQIGFVFQSFNLLPKLNVLDNVALPLTYRGMTQTRRLKKAAAMLERVGLSDREYFMPKQLSGGQAQRVAIARALISDPSIIIADEPTGNLDSSSSRLVMELLADVHKTGNTILLVTHNPELTRYASRVVFMHDGTIIGDERSKLGDVPKLAKSLYFLPRKTIEDDLAGVSVLMQEVEKEGPKKSKKAKNSTKQKTRKYQSRTKKKGTK
ncbi:ABC transporter ATP-binding protein [Candidatus Saccharibacteria bacterium]|nr:ABC transporter ATP-binding protein [Candidatus Saccharibacteria bacterium]MBI3338326.1 ABC transporter ATP-binding protein [Candidatus Saccharibacteria bacterium]